MRRQPTAWHEYSGCRDGIAVFKSGLITWLADAGNGIGNIFAETITATNVTAATGTFQTLCFGDTSGGKTCITKGQLDQLLEKQSVSAAAPPLAAPTVPSSQSTAKTSSSPIAEQATTTNSSTPEAMSSLPIVEAPPLVPDYTASTTVPAASSSPAAVASSTTE